ncbi:hypothetical protein ES705_25698 [subsurface metagenome]
MKIDEAIKTCEEVLGSSRLDHWAQAEAAVSLGIEALKQIREARKYNLILSEAVLPGETDEPLHV